MALAPAFLISPANFATVCFPPPAAAILTVAAQGSTPEDLVTSTRKALADVAAQNQAIWNKYGDDGLILTINDAELAGGGDGHTFVLTLTFLATAFNEVFGLIQLINSLNSFLGSPVDNNYFRPEALDFEFALASTAEALGPLYPDLIERILASDSLSGFAGGIFNMSAGAAKGTRFMLGVGAVVRLPAPFPPRALSVRRTSPGAPLSPQDETIRERMVRLNVFERAAAQFSPKKQ